MRPYEIMVILDPTLDERTVSPRRWRRSSTSSARTAARSTRSTSGASAGLAYEIAKHAEGIYAVIDVKAEPATVSELDRQLSLNESVLRTKVLRTDKH